MPVDTIIALNRFGLGARAGEQPPANPKQWLTHQLAAFEVKPSAFDQARSSNDIAEEYSASQQKIRASDEVGKEALQQAIRQQRQALHRSEVEMRVLASLTSSAPFVERLVLFWSNHFAISADTKPQVAALAGAFEREAIRPHVLGRFEDMLFAVERHPAMHYFLDQVRSIGPNSLAAERAARRQVKRGPGINENLAREILELHTLGVRSGYTQRDVTEFALALTGWSASATRTGAGGDEPGMFSFRPAFHEPGPRTVMGKAYAQPGEEQAAAILRDLAVAPATATHVATKLARHFIADTPPDAAIARLSSAFRTSRGDLRTIYGELIALPESWTELPRKFKTPWDWAISALRCIGRQDLSALNMANLLSQLGQPVWRPGSPAGYDDVTASWAAPDALVRRVEVAQRFVARVPSDVDARELARTVLGAALSERTLAEISRAESLRSGLALLLVSPEFQRR